MRDDLRLNYLSEMSMASALTTAASTWHVMVSKKLCDVNCKELRWQAAGEKDEEDFEKALV